jgi:hypothetical protein
VISEDEFYVTHWLAAPHDKYTVRKFGPTPWGTWKWLIGSALWGTPTTIHYVKAESGGKDITMMEDLFRAKMTNGVDWDGKSIFVADSLAKTLLRFDMREDKSLELVETIPTSRAVDNVEYDP